MTIRPLPARDETRAPQIAEDFFALRATTAEVRDSASRLSQEADNLHERVQQADLEYRASQLAQAEPGDALAVLGEDLAMSWSLVAELLQVTPTAVRKWRRGGPMTPENRLRLGHLIAFCEALREVNPRIIDPGLWLDTPLATATTIRPADLYAAGRPQQLLDVAADRVSATDALNQFDADWRTRRPSDRRFDVVVASDGVPSIVPRK